MASNEKSETEPQVFECEVLQRDRSREAVDNAMRLFNQELSAQVMADLTGTTPETWRQRLKRWWTR